MATDSTQNENKETFGHNSRNTVIAFIVGFIIGAGAMWLWVAVATPEGQEQANTNTTTTTTSTGAGTATPTVPNEDVSNVKKQLSITDQFPGTTVQVDRVVTDEPVWVVIHEEQNGIRGNALGAGWFGVGEHFGTVALLRAMDAGQSYVAVLYDDAGDDRIFDLEVDRPFEGTSAVSVRFLITTPPAASGN